LRPHRYEQASREIDVPGEIMNGLEYSALALTGSNLLASVSLAIHQNLWSHVPAIVGYGIAVVLGPKVIQAAVDGALRYSGLNSTQCRQLSPLLNTVGRDAMGFIPKVNASEKGVHYRYPSTEGSTETVTSRGSVCVAGGKVSSAHQRSPQQAARKPDTGDGRRLTLPSIHEVTQDNIKLYVLDRDGKKTRNTAAQFPGVAGPGSFERRQRFFCFRGREVRGPRLFGQFCGRHQWRPGDLMFGAIGVNAGMGAS
jgi:hypothetical protein